MKKARGSAIVRLVRGADAYRLGIDVGSTTVKTVVFERGAKRALFSRYRRHNACQSETARALLAETFAAFPGIDFSAGSAAAVCGSGGRLIADAARFPYIQEVVANAIAVRAFYPQARTAIELGGQDAKVVFFRRDERTGQIQPSDMRMNGNCAGGTGAFIDEVASLLRVPVEEFESLAAKGRSVYDISGRCGVFAKTDIQPLLNQGGLREDIALSAFHAIAKQTIGGLAQGLELTPPIIFEGGPLTFNPTLVRVFAERLALKAEDIIVPEQSETIVALGAALSVDEMFASSACGLSNGEILERLDAFREERKTAGQAAGKKYFYTPEEKAAFEERHKLPPPPEHGKKRGETLRAYLGIDAGSTTSKFVLLDEEERVVDSYYSSNRGDPLRVIKQALIALKEKYDAQGIALEIIALGTTGYGELLFDKAFGADYHTVETVAHAAAAQKYVPGATFILDIGGQDMKAINLSDGVVTNITVNEACSSGCGSFLENFAVSLQIPVETIAAAAFRSESPAELGSRCTVFMNSTIITEQKNGKTQEDIMAGLCRSIIENVFTKVVRISNFSSLGDRIVVQGGAFKNDAVLRALEQYLGKEVVRAPYPGEMGAVGIALLTKRRIEERGFGAGGKSRFLGLGSMRGFDYTQEANIRCGLCGNNCNRTHVVFSSGETWVTGNRCERGEIIGDPADPEVRRKLREVSRDMERVPDMLRFREQLLFKEYPFRRLLPERDTVIGLPRALDFWRTMPFFTTFFHALGFKTKVSPRSSKALYERGLPFVASDTVCFPAKLAHGHIHALAEGSGGGLRVFMPLFVHLPTDNPEKLSVYTCPVLKGYPLVIKYSDTPERRWNVAFDTPVFHWFKNADRNNQLCAYMKETFGIAEKHTRAAIRQADAALKSFNRELVGEGKRLMAQVEREGKFAVVISGRHYQFDEVVNHNLSRYFTSLGIPVLTVDSLPDIQKIPLRETRLDITNNNHARLLSGAIYAARHPALEYVEIFSFGCGHDALYTDEVTRVMSEISGKAPLVLKLDESDVPGPLRIRVRSFIETVETRRKKTAPAVRPLPEPYPVKLTRQHRKTKIMLIPNVSRGFSKSITAAIRRDGYRAVPLPMGSREAMALGKKYVHNDICFPAQMVIGEALAVLKSGIYNPDDVIVGTGKTPCDCRLVNYMVLTRKALDEAGFPQVPIISTDMWDVKKLHPGYKFSVMTFGRAAFCLVLLDELEALLRRVRPYELEKGRADKVFAESLDRITAAIEKHDVPAAWIAYRKSIDAFCEIPYDRSERRPVVFITGEYLMTFHPGANFYIEEYLEKNGMEVEIPKMADIYHNLMLYHTVSEVVDFHVKHSLFDKIFAFGGHIFFDRALDLAESYAKKHPLFVKTPYLSELAKLADPIIHHSIQSGEGFLMAGDILYHAAHGIKSFIMLQPWGCLPNHVCGRGIVKRLKEEYPAIQILPLDYDPDTSFANIENRLQMLIMNARAAHSGGAAADDARSTSGDKKAKTGSGASRKAVFDVIKQWAIWKMFTGEEKEKGDKTLWKQ
ncbi:MAG: acyl-CoA dehydratase activase [Treponematales bacterium]